MTEAIIKISGIQSDINGEPAKIELITEGIMYDLGTGKVIEYRESEMTGMEGTDTMVHLLDGLVTITRTGAVNTEMVFERGKRRMTHYDTPFGGFTVEVYANKAEYSVKEERVNVELTYDIFMNHSSAVGNELNIEVKPVH